VRILLLQHIADGPPDAYELELADRGTEVARGALTSANRSPIGATSLASSQWAAR